MHTSNRHSSSNTTFPVAFIILSLSVSSRQKSLQSGMNQYIIMMLRKRRNPKKERLQKKEKNLPMLASEVCHIIMIASTGWNHVHVLWGLLLFVIVNPRLKVYLQMTRVSKVSERWINTWNKITSPLPPTTIVTYLEEWRKAKGERKKSFHASATYLFWWK